ncbi:HipA domain-containing protein [Acaryochloris sp. CCMEE 5410]|uniref:HipA domain-containing protein n=1 Tax=Acaryochloris sp. CCMEE 5410 TaxID=310037 RepID=UPI0002483CAD
MNGRLVGFWHQSTTGANTFQYAEEWLATPGARPLSLSMPLRSKAYGGQQVYNFFENLLPDSKDIRNKIQTRFQTSTNQPFDLLSAVGSDCVGAVQLCHQLPGPNVKTVTKQVLTEAEIAERLQNHKMGPLGMTREVDDFRISIAGAQEKTGLLWHNQKWCLPTGTTPTSHIFKLPIGVITSHNIDLSESCENEWLCLKIAEAFGLPVAKVDIQTFEDVKVLVVERFDRKWSRDGSWLMRLPQEDMCQVFGVASIKKYQADGGPGIVEIMKILIGSNQPQVDREQFFKAQILFWLLAAIDGHGKNFSVYLDPNASYRLTPLYDVLSAYPSMQTKEIPKQKAKMAMALKGKRNRYEWSQIQLRHFLSTAKAAEFSEKQTVSLLLEMLEKAEFFAQQVQEQLPKDFPTHISQPILEGMTSLAKQNLPTLYQLIGNHAEKGEYENALTFYTKALNLKAEIQDQSGTASQVDISQVDIWHGIANIYVHQRQGKKALSVYEKILKLNKQIGSRKDQSVTLHQIANVYVNEGMEETALLIYEKSLKFEEQGKNLQGKAVTLHCIAVIYARQEKLDKALSYFEESLDIKEQIGDWKGQIDTLHQIANVYDQNQDIEQALSFDSKAFEIATENKDVHKQADILHSMASLYAQQRQIKQALSYFEQSLTLREELQDLQGKAITLARMGQMLARDQGDFDKAIIHIQKSLEILRALESPDVTNVGNILTHIRETRRDSNRASK